VLSNISRLPIFLASADRIIHLHDQLIRHKENTPTKHNAKGSPKNATKFVHTRSHGVQAAVSAQTRHCATQTDHIEPRVVVTPSPTPTHPPKVDTKQIEALQGQIEQFTSQMKKME
jgi:hypothetical protein